MSLPAAEENVCAVCGRPLDPVRAGAVGVYGERILCFCDAACKARLGMDSFPPPPREEPSGEGDEPDARRGRREASSKAPPEKPPERLRLLVGLGLTLVATTSAYLVEHPGGSLAVGLATTIGAVWLHVAAALAARKAGGSPFDDLSIALAIAMAAAAAVIGPGYGAPPRAGPGLAVATSVCAAVMTGRWLESLAYARAWAPLVRLSSAVDVPARVLRQGEVEVVPASAVRAGEEVAVGPGETVPADGVVRSGSAEVTPYPGARSRILRSEGDPVIAGARVQEGELVLLATFSGPERSVVRIARVVDPGATRPAPLAVVARRLAGAVSALATIVGVGLVIGLPVVWRVQLPEALLASASLLAIAGPRALRRSATAPLLAAAARSAGRGAFFRDGAAAEGAARVVATVLATRGTLTVGRPEVRDVVAVGDREEGEIVALAAAAEGAAPGHPLAAAIRRRAERDGLEVPEPRRLAERPGRGVLGAGPRGESIAVGTRRLLLEEGVSVAAADRAARDIEAARQTAVLVAISDRVQGVLSLDDPLREDAVDAVAKLVDLGTEPVLLTGDSRGTAEALGEALGIEHVRAEVEPADRAVEVRRFAEAGTVVAVIGHPRRDDSALSAADVSVALGAAGAPKADAAIRLAGDSLDDAVAALADARRALALARRNLVGAFLVVVAGGIVGGAGLLPLPVAGAIGAIAAALVEWSGAR